MPPNAVPHPSGPYTHSSHTYESQDESASRSIQGSHGALLGSSPRHHSGGVVASHFLAQDAETWMDFLRDGTETRVNQQPSSSELDPAAAHEARANPSSTRYSLPSHPSSRTDSSSSLSSDRKRRLTTADSPLRRPSSIRIHSEGAGNTSSDPIMVDSSPASLRALPPTPPVPPQTNTTPARRQSDIVLPPWQPDSDVTQCPVCKRPFTFLLRRHHCRKCGRVVCASCSPHRITIPRQFIVHPPSEGTANFIDLTGDDDNDMSAFGPFRNPALGGGEEVRVCNPCVPDPNFSPPPQCPSPGRDPRYTFQLPPSSRSHHAAPPHSRGHRPSSTVHDVPRFASQGHVYTQRDRPNDNSQSRRVTYNGSSSIRDRQLPPLPPFATQQQHPHHRAPLISQTLSNNRPRHRSTFGATTFAGSPFGQATSSAIPLPSHHTQLPQPRRQIPEEDECPICGEELPPKGPGGDDKDRTQHIEDCIALHSASPGPKATPAPQTSASLPTQRTRGMSSAGNGEGASNRMSHAARGMFPYIATEKDCFDDEGAQAECTICLEDFEAGDRMARLVCWCKFHESCIKVWWDKKGRGACPTHQLQE